MHSSKFAIDSDSEGFSKVIVLEAPEGTSRCKWLQDFLAGHAGSDVRAFFLSSDFDSDGPWAGVTGLFTELFGEIQRDRPDLIEKHGFELVYLLPSLRRSLDIRNPNLTDTAPRSERTRNYPADRAVRNIHGLIDLLDEWKTTSRPTTPWVIACDSFDKAGAMGSLFFREMMRRRGRRLNIRLVVGVEVGNGLSTSESFDSGLQIEWIARQLDTQLARVPDSDEAAELVTALETRIGDDEFEQQANLPRLIQLAECAGDADRVLRYRFLALETYNTQGLYADAIHYGRGARG
jgi:hypothetical protein